MTQTEAEYMELQGAVKDSDCEIVHGRISSRRGCCRYYEFVEGADEFRCGECVYQEK